MKLTVAAALLALISHAACAGTITNGDFASNDVSGWTTTAATTATHPASMVVVSNHGVLLSAGLGNSVYTTLSQLLHLDAGDVLSGTAQFFANDFAPYNDAAFVAINGLNLFAADVSSSSAPGPGTPSSFSFLVLTSGDYLLSAGVANIGDNLNDSALRVSGFQVNAGASVPLPATPALLGLGLAALAAARRRRARSEQA